MQGGPHLNLRVQQPGRPYKLLHHHSLGLAQLVIGRGGTHIDGLPHKGFKFFELQWPVVPGRRKSETIIHQIGLAGAVPTVHGMNLRNRHMAFINDGHKILGEVVQQTKRTGTGFPAVKIA